MIQRAEPTYPLRLIKDFPTVVLAVPDDKENGTGVHESKLRAYQILCKVKEYLKLNTPSTVILEIIEDLEGIPSGDIIHPGYLK